MSMNEEDEKLSKHGVLNSEAVYDIFKRGAQCDSRTTASNVIVYAASEHNNTNC
jgi:hypothetical protein